MNDMLAPTKRNVGTAEMRSSFTGNVPTIHLSKSVVQLASVVFISTLDGPSAGREVTVGRRDKLHGLGVIWEQVIAPMMLEFTTSISNSTRWA